MTTLKRRRCLWAEGNPVMRHYHDVEWGVVQQDARALWEMLMLLRLLDNSNIIRSRAKIEATIRGAQIYCAMAERGEDLHDFCWSFTHGKALEGDGKNFPVSSSMSERISKELKRRGFKFVEPTIVYAWMQAVGIVNDHAATCFRRTQV